MQKKSLKRIAAAVGLTSALALGACSNDPTSASSADTQPLVLARFGSSAPSPNAQLSDPAPQRLVIADANAFASFWSSLSGNLATGPQSPTVDFSQSTVIAVASSVKPTSGYTISIERVVEHADHLEVDVVERTPSTSCATLQVLTRPYDLVQIARRDGKRVQFVERTGVNSCSTAAPDSARVAFGKTVDARGVKITLLAVESDSRCPINALCIWEGDAALRFRFESSGATSDVTLHTSPRAGVVSIVIAGVEFQLARVDPFRVINDQPAPKPSDYVAVLTLR